MKLNRPIIKRASDDYDDEWIWFEPGTSYELSERESFRPKSMSRAAHAAINYRPPNRIGFHKP